MKSYKNIKYILLILSIIFSVRADAAVNKPIALDSRIKTMIYSENEVFRIVVNYGYQTIVEFAENEEIQTISAGNNYAWNLVPVGRRLFIKPLEDNILTNMTILTNMRAYHFEIQSKTMYNSIDEELIYVARFFYPEEGFDSLNARPDVISASKKDTLPSLKPYNFNYTVSGPEKLAPLKIFDDGINTFFKFDDNLKILPTLAVKTAGGFENLEMRRRGDYIVTNVVAKEFKVTLNGEDVAIYNEGKP